MKLSFATLGCPGWALDQIVRQALALGYDGVDLRGAADEPVGPDTSPAERSVIRRRFAAAGVAIACIMGYTRFTEADPGQRRKSIAEGLKFIEIARDLGCPLLRVFGGTLSKVGREEGRRLVVDGLREMAALAERSGVVIVLETHDSWCQGAAVREVMETVRSPAIGVCWDIANSFLAEPPERTFREIRDFLRHVHVKDAVRLDNGAVKARLPGQGQVPIKQALDLLLQIGYPGYVSFEWEKKWEPDIEAPEVALPHFVRHMAEIMKPRPQA